MDEHTTDRASADQPHPHEALGTEPVRTIGREELKAMLDRGDDLKLLVARPPGGSASRVLTHDAEHLGRLREWVAELIGRRSAEAD